jgi:hypothetical protein
MWSAFACDVVTTYAFGYNNDQVGSEDFKDNLHEAFLALSEFGHLALQFPWITPVNHRNQIKNNKELTKYSSWKCFQRNGLLQ